MPHVEERRWASRDPLSCPCPPARYKQVERPADEEDVKVPGKEAAVINTTWRAQARRGPSRHERVWLQDDGILLDVLI